ncbi:protein of unknown function [Candidatus Filomicrobium marinum]|uniref:Uncharacterized protein n=1 Tax=Candidatus Filomicrobium marinum TaxID=1608628 RepID=A0A0D6JFI0_9HYPH|nr:protein of unknown function [Candidatus Filomicrobium marinum]CPR19526.1 protein of unknown function [Candidatus Filomicrobium marinum]
MGFPGLRTLSDDNRLDIPRRAVSFRLQQHALRVVHPVNALSFVSHWCGARRAILARPNSPVSPLEESLQGWKFSLELSLSGENAYIFCNPFHRNDTILTCN